MCSLQPLPHNRISLLALRSHPFFSDTAPASPLPSCSFPSSTFTSSSSSSATTTPISRVVSLANASSSYDMNTCGSQDISIATSARGSASTPSTAPRAVVSSRADKEQEEGAGGEKAALWLQRHLQAPAVTPPLDSSLRVVPSNSPAAPLLSITCAFGCISLYRPVAMFPLLLSIFSHHPSSALLPAQLPRFARHVACAPPFNRRLHLLEPARSTTAGTRAQATRRPSAPQRCNRGSLFTRRLIFTKRLPASPFPLPTLSTSP
jgi:hypothetical protein